MTRRLPETADHPPSEATSSATKPVELLILGAGWTSTFLIPLLQEEKIIHAATSTTGHDSTIPFRFDPSNSTEKDFSVLPTANTIIITFPLTGEGQSARLVDLYLRSRPHSERDEAKKYCPLFIQLGSTGIFSAPHWNDHRSSYEKTNSRAQAEDELLRIPGTGTPCCSSVLNLAGLYGGARDPKAWLPRVIKTKGDVAGKKALHLVHGVDVARAIVAAHRKPEAVKGQRWIICDLHVYDWWELIYEWTREGSGRETLSVAVEEKEGERETLRLREEVLRLMREKEVRALPRAPESLGRVLDGRDFWEAVGSWPNIGRVT